MELDNIKLGTTWNDAAGSINNNFAKLKLAIAALIAEGGGFNEEQLAAYLQANGYTTEQWIALQEFIKLGSLDTEIKEDSVNAVQNKVIKAYVDGRAAAAQAAAEQYIQNEVLTYYATTKYVGEREDYIVGYAEGLVNTLEKDIDSRGYLTSAAMTNYATKNDIKDFVTKGTTLAHYGITDAVRTSATFSPTDNPNVMGYGKIDNGWPNVGPSMIIGTTGYYLRVNSVSEINDSPKVYVSNVYNNTECGWAQLITDKNFNQFGISVLQNLADDADTLASPSVAGYYNNTSNTPFNFGNILTLGTPSIVYKTQIAANVYGRIALRSYNNAWTDWYEILTSNNIGGYALTQTNADARYLKLSGGTLTGQLYVQNSAGDRYIHSECDTAHIAFGVGSGGNNRGIFDINDGKWWIVRNNSDYTEIVSSTMSLVGKVNVTGLLEARSGITLGNVTRTSWPAEGIAKNSILLPNNAFDNFGKIQFSQLDNALYAAAHRFNITLNGFNSDSKGVLFNGSYEDSIKVPVGQTATIRIDNNGNYIIAGHPYGKIVLSFYYQSVPASVSVRVYDTYGTPGWYTLSLSEVRGNNGGVFVFDNTSYYGITEIEITITAKADIEASLAEIDWFLTRASLSNLPVVSKFAIDQELWGRLICKGGITLGNRTITSWDDIKASGDYLPLTGGTLSGNLTVTGQVNASAFNLQTNLASVYFYTNIFTLNASLQINGGWVLRLNGEGITSWGDLKAILGLKSLAYKDSIAFSEITSKPTTLSGYGITDAYTRAQVDALIANVEGGSGSGTGNITIDSALSETSVNPVQNNVITANINRINASLTSVNTTLGSLRSLAYKEKVDWDTDIENIPDDLGGEIKVVSQTATSGTVGINPNVINKWGSLSSTDSFTIAFNDGEDGVANYYMLEFKMTATSPTITLPDSVVWANGYNVLENITSNRAATCQISILDGLAVGAIFYDE